MALNKGDFILIDYTAKIKETGELIDTTIEEVAKRENAYREDKVYEPILVILGEHRVVRGLEEELEKMDVGEEKTIEVEPARAYGERDPNKVKIMSIREFARRGITPRPGDIVEIGGLPAVIRNVSGGRVIVDFNHPLAGKTIIYEVKILSKVESDVDKVKQLVHRRIKAVPVEKLNVKLARGTARIEIPPDAFLLEDIQYAKQAIVRDIERYIDSVRRVEFIEVFEIARGEEKEEEKKTRRTRAKRKRSSSK